ncbi:tRNA isopentenyltransferase, partial [Nadsonia fulvescens var. elongata DSM 6958]
RSLITIIGTTGVGKSQFSIDLASHINGEIINGDSMQVYRDLSQITNKHPIEERKGIPHHLLGHVDWSQEYSVEQFEREAISIMEDIWLRGKTPILIGGTHYYNQATIIEKGDDESLISSMVKEEPLSQKELANLELSGPAMWKLLDEVDPIIAGKFHPNDKRRVRRMLEIFYQTNTRPSDIYAIQRKAANDTSVDGDSDSSNSTSDLRFRSLVFWIYSNPKTLEPRLDMRVDNMLTHGLYNEIDQLYDYFKAMSSPDLQRGVLQVIGFKEFLPWLDARAKNLSSASTLNETNYNQKTLDNLLHDSITQMKSVTRKYAKKQIKWITKKFLINMQSAHQANPHMGGQVVLLDATDLNQWNQTVLDRGLVFGQEFINSPSSSEISFSLPLAPDSDPVFTTLLTPKYTVDNSANPSNWKHFICDICKINEGTDFYVAVGQSQWDTHLESRKHRQMIRKLKAKSALEDYRKRKAE